MIYKTELSDIPNLVVHILAHQLRDMIIKAVVGKQHMIVSILNKRLRIFFLTMAAQAHTVIKYRCKAYDIIRIRSTRNWILLR